LGERAVAFKISRVLEMLGDGKWHGMKEIQQLMNLNERELQEITRFLTTYDFAEVDKANKRVRATRDFQKIEAQNAT
jgi:DNA-binding IclR family transcriptional regulator